MEPKLQYTIFKQFPSRKQYLPFSNIAGLVSKVLELSGWEHLHDHGKALAAFCTQSIITIKQRWEAIKEDKKKKREARRQQATVLSPIDRRRKLTNQEALPSATRIRQEL